MSALLTILLVGIRMSAMLITAPILGNRNVPFFVKLILALSLTLAVAPIVVESNLSQPIAPADFFTAVMTELLVGSTIGIGILIIFSAAQMVGGAIGQLSGLQLDTAFQEDSSTGRLPTERLIGFVAVAVFVLSGGPEMSIGAVLDSLTTLPIGSTIQRATLLNLVTCLLMQSFELTVLAIAPAVASLLISTIVVGILTRTLPQLNLIQVGLSSNVAMMMLALMLTLGGCIWMVVDEIQPAIARILNGLETVSQTN